MCCREFAARSCIEMKDDAEPRDLDIASAGAGLWSLDHVGPLAKTVAEAGSVLAAIAGKDPRDPSSHVREMLEGGALLPASYVTPALKPVGEAFSKGGCIVCHGVACS